MVHRDAGIGSPDGSLSAFGSLNPAVLRQALAASAVPSALVATDGSFLWVNQAICDLLGRPTPELLLATWQELTHPDDVAADEALAADVLAGRRDSYRMRKRYHAREGALIWGDLTVSRVPDGGGEFLCYLAQIVDVTEWVLAAKRYRTLAERAADFITETEPSGRLAWVSEGVTTVLGWQPEELRGTEFRALIHPEDRLSDTEVDRIWSGSVTADQGGVKSVKRLRHKDGSYRFCDLRAALVPTPDESEVLLQATWRDIDAQERDRRALQRSQERLAGVLKAELDGHVVLTAIRDEVGRIVDMRYEEVNPVACEVFGQPREQIVGRRLLEVSPEAASLGRMAQYAQVVETGTPLTWTATPIESSAIESGRYFDTRVVKVGDGVAIAFRDVSDDVLAAQRLAESERRYRLIAENAADAVFSATPQGVFTYFSPSVEQLLGLAPEDLVGRTPLDILHPDDIPTLRGHMKAVTNGESVSFRSRIRTGQGDYRWVGVVAHPVRDAAGALIARTGSWRDAEAEVAAENRLREQRQRLRATLDVQIDPHLILEAVRDETSAIVDFVVSDANSAAQTDFGMSREELLGVGLMSRYPAPLGQELRNLLAKTVESGAALVMDEYPFNDAQRGGERRLYDVRGVKLDDGISVTWRDVTERGELLHDLTDSEEHFRLLAHNSSDVVVLFQDGAFRWVSPALSEQLGWQPEEWVGHAGDEFTHPDDLDLRLTEVRRALAGEDRVWRMRLRNCDGEYQWVEIHAGPYLDSDGKLVGLVASFRVITAEVRVERERDRLAQRDSLTGLLIRREMLRRVQSLTEVGGEVVADAQPLAILFCDLDRLKPLNDEHGHVAGDRAIQTVAQRVTAAVRPGDPVSRFGGDEILVALPGVGNRDQARLIAEKIRIAVAEPMDLGAGLHVRLTLSIGVALAQPKQNLEDLISRADAAMYVAKRAGGNRIIAVE